MILQAVLAAVVVLENWTKLDSQYMGKEILNSVKYKTYEQLLIVVNSCATIDISFAENRI